MNKPASLTSHDFLKTFAVVIMVIDHVGYYFFPDVMWWRAIGRIGFPIWFYLAGHASGRDIPLKLWGGAVFLLVMNAVTGMSLFPLNALFTIILLRLGIDKVMRAVRTDTSNLWRILLLCVLLFFPTNMAFEYGTLAVMFAMFGYMVRHRDEDVFAKGRIQNYMIAIGIIFLLYQKLVFGFSHSEFITMSIGTMLVCTLLLEFRAISFSLPGRLFQPLRLVFQFCGRRTLEIYVVHLTIFKLAALALGYEGFALFDLHMF